MANELFSKDIGVYVKDGGDWKLAVCTKNKSVSVSVGSVEINNDCTGDFVAQLPSTATWTMSFEGDTNTNPSSLEVSAEDLMGFALSRAVKEWKFESADLYYVRYGEAFISQMDETATTPEYQTYSITLNGSGSLFQSETT